MSEVQQERELLKAPAGAVAHVFLGPRAGRWVKTDLPSSPWVNTETGEACLGEHLTDAKHPTRIIKKT